MYVLNEVFPFLGGILTGLICAAVSSSRLRIVTWAGLSVLFGAAATVISGEWHFGWEFLLFDIPLVAIVALLVVMLGRFGLRMRHRS